MKRRSREISIFSMSALDLFASALGAFILISVVIFPYFPNTVKECPPARVCPAPAPVPECPVCPAAPTPAPPATQFPHLDMVIALDVSGSMRDQLTQLKLEIDQLARVLDGLTPSLGIGIVAFGDRRWDEPTIAHDLQEISGSPSSLRELRDFVVNMDVNMGIGGGENPDGPEAVLTALTAAIGMAWRPEAELRMIVMITDNPAYPEQVGSAVDTARRFASSGGRVSTVSVGAEGAGFLRDLANAGSGEFVPDTGGSLTANLLFVPDMMSRVRAILVGRDSGCDVPLGDGSVSRQHAEVICLADGQLHITDRSSTNGTLVRKNDVWTPIRQAFVGAGDVLRFGDYRISAQDLGTLCARALAAAETGSLHDAEGEGLDPSRPKSRNPETGEIVDR